MWTRRSFIAPTDETLAGAEAAAEDTFPEIDEVHRGLPPTTGRSLVTLRPGLSRPAFNDLIEFVRRSLPADRHEREIEPGLVKPEPFYWEEYGVAVIPASAADLLTLPAERMKSLGVGTIEPEGYLRASIGTYRQPPQPTTWGLDETGAARSTKSGAGVRIAILDTGIATRHRAFGHPTLGNRIAATTSCITGFSVEDVFGHGTHIAGVACGALPAQGHLRYGIAYEATILAARVLTDKGLTAHAYIIDGIRWAQKQRADIAVMAFGGTVMLKQRYLKAINDVAEVALRGGLLIIAETGNDQDPNNVDPVNSPADCPAIMSVGSVGPSLKPSPFSCGGRNLDAEVNVVAPGELVLGAWPPDTTKVLRGTSQATAFAAGIAAMWAQGSAERGRALWNRLETEIRPLRFSPVEVGRGFVQSPR
jgi:subtilisin family serine protease